MSPAKRTKKSSPPPAPPSPPASALDPPTAPEDEPDDADDGVSTDSSAPTFDSLMSIDPALLDEEEVPNTSTSSTSTSAKAGGYAGGYNALKTHKGQVYSGMAVGGSHTWEYQPGVWKETKEEPDLWKIDYRATKKRARKAPKGSGAPVGTEYHWMIVAHQYVRKTDANTYETHLTGSKYKLAHKTAASSSWSIPKVKAQREREVELLEDAKRRVLGLAPVHAGEKVKIATHEKGQMKLDGMFGRQAGGSGGERIPGKRKRGEEEGENGSSAVDGDEAGSEGE